MSHIYRRTTRRFTDDKTEEDIEDMALEALTDEDCRSAVESNATATLYVQGRFGLNPADFEDADALSDAIQAVKDGKAAVIDEFPDGQLSGAVVLTDEDKAERRANECLGFEEVAEAHEKELSAQEYIKRKYRVDPADYDLKMDLHDAIRQARTNGDVNYVK